MRLSEPKLFDLNPSSVLKVYKIISEFVELNFKSLKTENDLISIFNKVDYTTEEKYYIAYYLPKYLNLNNDKNQISEIKRYIEDSGDVEDLKVGWNIKEYCETLSRVCDYNFKKFRRIYNYNLKSGQLIIDSQSFNFIQTLKWNRLPLNGEKRNEFIEFVKSQLQPFYPKNDIELLINNSFDILPLSNESSFLNFNIDRSSDIYRAFYYIYKEYKNRKEHLIDIADSNQVRIAKPKNQKISENGKYKRADFIEKLNVREYKNATSKINIAKIMFMSFPKIRENYIIHMSKTKVDLDSYLKTLSRNIKK